MRDVHSMVNLGQAAQQYARHGWYVFPLAAREKRPHPVLAPRGFYDATRDVAAIERWWASEPSANIGLWPAPSGLLVLDIDGPEGETSAGSLGVVFDDGAATLTCITGRVDGRHLYFLHPGFAVGNRSLGPGLDVRADAGYVVIPPSLHPSGQAYRWYGRLGDIPPVPECLLKRLRPAQLDEQDDVHDHNHQPSTAAAPPRCVRPAPVDGDRLARRIGAYAARLPWPCVVGLRNNVAYQFAAWLTHDLALPVPVAWEWLASWNAYACRPLLGGRELHAVLVSAARHGRRVIGTGVAR